MQKQFLDNNKYRRCSLNYRILSKYAYFITLDHLKARDLLECTFEAARKADGIANNDSINEMQFYKKQMWRIAKEQFDICDEECTEIISCEPTTNIKEVWKGIGDTVFSLPTPVRIATVARFLEELSVEEIAEFMCTSVKTTNDRIECGRQAVHKDLYRYQKETEKIDIEILVTMKSIVLQ